MGENIFIALTHSKIQKVIEKLTNIRNVAFGPECTKETQTLAHHLF